MKVQGYVEYVAYENGKAFISIDGSTYSLDDVIAVVDETYQTAYDLAVSFVDAVGKLPIPEELNLKDHQERIETLQKAFNNMTAYQQSFIPDETIEKLKKCVEKIAELKAAEDADNHRRVIRMRPRAQTVRATEIRRTKAYRMARRR